MKTNFKSVFILLAGVTLLFSSCERDEVTVEDDANLVTEASSDIINNQTPPRDAVTDKAVLDLIRTLEIDAGAITKGDFHLPDGTIEQRIYIGDDIAVTEAELKAMQAIDAQSRQYRTFNLVTGNNRTIDILGYTGGSQALSSKARTALQWAVANYNRLSGVSLQFNLTFGTNFQAADMVVYDNTVNTPGGTGGVAGFPSSSGRPNKFVQIYGIEGFSTNVNEHVITHEIGHSVGFRHSDWFDRLSCPTSSQGNEGTGSDGAVHIAGTPTGRDLSSIMQACFSSSADGEFNNNDITALRSMY